ncbi:MAG: AAA family ATPase [Acidobacteria bacterium]|nr:AAA family ATPase [Acidobacteriota bacterium]
MKIKQLDVKGFRSLKDVSWRPGDLNVVIGQNGTGKSNLLRMLELISASAQGRLSKYIESAGGINAILWDGVASSISFCLKVRAGELPIEWEESYEVEIDDWLFDIPQVKRETWVSNKEKPNGEEPYVATVIDRSSKQILFNGEQLSSAKTVPDEETLLSLINSLSFEAKQPGASLDTAVFRQRLAGITVYHDLDVGQNSRIRQSAVPSFERRIEPDGQNLVPVLHTLYTGDREFKRNIDSAMHAAFGSDYEEIVFPPASDRRIQFRVRWKNLKREQPAADLSDGTLRFLLLLTALITPEPPMVIAIDEPETGLHPAMLPIIAEFAMEAASRTQIVFTTHSPQFLDAFTDAKPTTTVAKWENGETTLHTLEGEDLAYWLEDYSLGRLFQSGQLEAMT